MYVIVENSGMFNEQVQAHKRYSTLTEAYTALDAGYTAYELDVMAVRVARVVAMDADDNITELTYEI